MDNGSTEISIRGNIERIDRFDELAENIVNNCRTITPIKSNSLKVI